MNAARATIAKVTAGHGKHTTEVHKHQAPAVTHEKVLPTLQQETTTYVNKEIHTDHYHTSILPIRQTETLPTEHINNILPTRHTEHFHGNHGNMQQKLSSEAASFKDQSQVNATKETRIDAPMYTGVTNHHHVHETFQPIIQKQTIAPSIQHNIHPVHEVHHSEPEHQTSSTLPSIGLSDFRAQGGSTTGLTQKTEHFKGRPNSIEHKADNLGRHKHTQSQDSATGADFGHAASPTTNNTHSPIQSNNNAANSPSSIPAISNVGRHNQTLPQDSVTGANPNLTSSPIASKDTHSPVLSNNNTVNTPVSTPTKSTTASSPKQQTYQQAPIDPRVDRVSPAGKSSTFGNMKSHIMNSVSSSNKTSNSTHATAGTTPVSANGMGVDTNHTTNMNTTTATTGVSTGTGMGTGMGAVGNTSPKSTKPSLMARMNPFTDSDGDGKKGFMH